MGYLAHPCGSHYVDHAGHDGLDEVVGRGLLCFRRVTNQVDDHSCLSLLGFISSHTVVERVAVGDGKEGAWLRLVAHGCFAEDAAQGRFHLLHVEVADDHHIDHGGVKPCSIELPKAFRGDGFDVSNCSEHIMVLIGRATQQRVGPLYLDTRVGIVAHGELTKDRPALMLDAVVFQFEGIGPVGHDHQTRVQKLGILCRHLAECVYGLVFRGVCVDVVSVEHAVALQHVYHRVTGEMLCALEHLMLQVVRHAMLSWLLCQGTDAVDKIEASLMARCGIVANHVSDAIVQASCHYIVVKRQGRGLGEKGCSAKEATHEEREFMKFHWHLLI